MSYLVFATAVVLVVLFCLTQFFNIDFHDLVDYVTGRHRGIGAHNARVGHHQGGPGSHYGYHP